MNPIMTACVVDWSMTALSITMLIVTSGIVWRMIWRDARQRHAERIRAGMFTGEPCSYCGLVGQPVEMDWRAPGFERRWVCMNARACVARGKVG